MIHHHRWFILVSPNKQTSSMIFKGTPNIWCWSMLKHSFFLFFLGLVQFACPFVWHLNHGRWQWFWDHLPSADDCHGQAGNGPSCQQWNCWLISIGWRKPHQESHKWQPFTTRLGTWGRTSRTVALPTDFGSDSRPFELTREWLYHGRIFNGPWWHGIQKWEVSCLWAPFSWCFWSIFSGPLTGHSL